MLHGHYDRVTCCAVFDDNSRIVSGSAGGALRVWHLILEEETGPSTGTLMGQQQEEQGENNSSCGAGHTGAITALVTIERTPEKQMRGGRGPAADVTAPPPPPSRERAKLRVRFQIIRNLETMHD